MPTVRPAFDDDAEAVRRVARAAWHAAYDVLDPEVIDETIDDWYDDPLGSSLTGWAENAPARDIEVTVRLFVAERREHVVGFVQGVATGSQGAILRLYVHPAHQGEGIGTALYDRVLETFREHGVEQVRAFDLADNHASHEFFLRHGFEAAGTGRVTIGGDAYDEVVYERPLDAN